MVRKDGKWIKQQRLKEIVALVNPKFPEGVKWRLTILTLKMYGYREATAEEYLTDLAEFHNWVLVDLPDETGKKELWIKPPGWAPEV